MGSRLGVWKGVLWVCFCIRRVAGVLWWNFYWAGLGVSSGRDREVSWVIL